MDDEVGRMPVVVVMGVTGVGKSTVGGLLAERLGAPFGEGDDLHPPANVAKMAAGHPLDDTDRWPWLREVAAWIRDHAGESRSQGQGAVVTCSALKREYRDLLRQAADDVWFLHLVAAPELVTERVAARPGHFMPAALVDSQFETLEPLGSDEAGFVVSTSRNATDVVERALSALDAAYGKNGRPRHVT